jgi:hypothetical protein
MNMFRTLETMSHATVITGNRENNLEQLKAFLSEQGIIIQGNPDVYIFNDEQPLTDDVEKIVSMLSLQKVSGCRFCIISCDRIDAQVQNRLLKTIEEPHEGTYVVLVIPSIDQLLPTILSRCQVILGNTDQGVSRIDVADFLKKSVVDRFAFIESWTKNKKDEDNVTKTEVLTFIELLEKKLWEQGNRNEQLFADIRKMHEYASTRGSSHRIILDFLALVCPKG